MPLESSNITISDNTGRIAFIQSSWHDDIVQQGKIGFLEQIEKLGISPNLVDFFVLPGAYEIPLKCKQVCKTQKYAAVVAAGFVVNGGIYQHEFVAQAVLDGLMSVQLEMEIPVLSMVLTPLHYDDSEEKNDFFIKHFRIKGREAADTLYALIDQE